MGAGGHRMAGATSPVVAKLESAPPDTRPRLMMDWVATRVATFLGWDGADDVAPVDHFIDDLGFDSLRALDFKDILEAELAIQVRTTALFDQPTPQDLVDWLLNEVLELGPGTSVTAPTREGAGPGAPIAIIGMACRLPGGADSPDAFWSLLKEGRDAITEVPPDRWPVDRLYDPDIAAPGKMNTRYGGFVDDIDRFDAAFFGLSPREATQLDPQQRMLLETTWEALENAGVDAHALRGTDGGVFVGMRASEYFDSQCDRGPLDGNQYYATGNAISTAAGRISYFLGLTGPCMAIDTACSASLVALHVACQQLRAGDCGVAVCGGVNAVIDAVGSISLSKAGMLSPDGRCKAFDASANGYGRAEGCGVVVLKPLEQAMADGDSVLAVIRGSAINQDGASGGLTVPCGPSQEAVIRAALRDGGIEPREVQYVEAHGTGTSLGDPIELQALDAVYGPGHADRPLMVGSVKTNLGHLEPAAGISGLMKVVLSLQRGHIPPHLHLEHPSPHIPWDDLRVTVPTGGICWEAEGPRRAGVSSFGFSGTNAHVVLEQAPARPAPAASPRSVELVTFSAKTLEARQELLQSWTRRLRADDTASLASIARAANVGRADHPYRSALIARDRQDLARQLQELSEDSAAGHGVHGHAPSFAPRVGWMFTGQGSQHPGMARRLYETQPVFRVVLDRCARALDGLRQESLLSVLWGDSSELLSRTDYTQPALFALEVALAETWRSWGAAPDAVLGHSVGEYAAACVAGVFSIEDGLRLIAARGGLMVERCEPGRMVAVAADAERVAPFVGRHPDKVSIAVLNGPSSVVVSGDPETVARITAELDADGVRSTELDVSHAFHSPMMEPMLEDFREVAESVTYSSPRCTFFSNLVGGVIGDEIATADYWVRHVREPVRFVDGLRSLSEEVDLLLEIGPKPTLCAMGRACTERRDLMWLPSLRPGQDDWSVMLRTVADLWVRGTPIDWSGVHQGEIPAPVTLPTYPFQRQSFWLEHGRGGNWRVSGDEPGHPLLGAPVHAAVLADGERLFQSQLDARSPSWLSDHQVHGVAVVPAAAFLEMMLSAASRSVGRPVVLGNVAIEAPLLLDTSSVTVQTVVRPAPDGAVSVKVCSLGSDETWTTHASATATAGPGDQEALVDVDAVPRDDPAAFYERYADIGLAYGPAFRAVTAIGRADQAAATTIEVPAPGDFTGWTLHPIVLDAAFQSAAAALGEGFDDAWLPVGLERLSVVSTSTRVTCRVRVRQSDDTARRVLVLDFDLVDAKERPVATVRGLRLVRAPREALLEGRDVVGDLLYEVSWVPCGPFEPMERDAERWLVVGEEMGIDAGLVAGGCVVQDRLDERISGVVHVARNGAASELCASLLETVQSLTRSGLPRAPRLVVVTTSAAPVGDASRIEPDQAALNGFCASIAREHPEHRVLHVDIGPGTPGEDVANVVLADSDEDHVAIRPDGCWSPRLQRRTPAGAGEDRLVAPDGPFELRALSYGSFTHIQPVPLTPRPPQAGEVCVAVSAAALNFKDVLHVLGLLEEWSRAGGIEAAHEQPLGFEAAGVVTAVGDGVEAFEVGDRVVATGKGCLATSVTTRADSVVHIPDELEFEDAASLPTVFVTAAYALEHLAKIQPGERVLVHAAAGGVGQAAVQLAQAAGCEVWGTASAPKRAHLLEQGVQRVMDSRSLAFGDEVAAATDGDGVDVVLNSLAGDAIPTSLDATARNGRFVDIGKIGAWTDDQVGERRPDLRYWNFDMSEVSAAEPGVYSAILRDVVGRVAQGSLRPPPVTTFDLADARAAFAHLAGARNIGKVVIRFQREPVVRDDRTYLVTGGLGALGLHAARRLVDEGARHVSLVGRSEASSEARAAIAGLREAGADVRIASLDVADAGAVDSFVDDLVARGLALGGVFFAAGVLSDGMLMNQTPDAFVTVMHPKIDGLVALADALDRRSVEPDWWVCTSSMVSVLGAQGQAPYAAANAWMDAWCHRRRAAGHRATSINWGPWAGGGMAASVASRNQVRFAEMGLRPIEPELGTTALLRVIEDDGAQVAVLPIRWARWMTQYRGGVPPLLEAYRSASPEGSGARAAILDDLEAASAKDRPAIILDFLVDQLAKVLGWATTDQIETDRPFGDLGVDSLLAVDMRNRLESIFGLPLPATLLFDHPSLDALAAYLAGELRTEEEARAAPPTPVPDDLDALSEAELAQRLADTIDALDE